MQTARDLVAATRAITLLLWPLTTLASAQSLGAVMGAISLADVLSVLVLSGVSGLVALLYRLRKSMEAALFVQDHPERVDEVQRISWKVYAAAHMAGSVFAGGLAFLIYDSFNSDRYLEAAVIALASWSGAKFADTLADGVSDSIRTRIASIISPKRE